MSGGAEHRRHQGRTEAEAAAAEVYAGILARTPEHDFEPTLDRVREAVLEAAGRELAPVGRSLS